jgi:biotin carboxyl carrier protein
MSTRYIVQRGGKEITVDISAVPEGYELTMNGRTVLVDYKAIHGNPTRSLILDGKSFEVATQESRDGQDVYVSGDVYCVRVADELWARAEEGAHGGPSGVEQIKSPMPGAVVAIKVEPDQMVQPGDVVAVVEAMKMQNDLAANQGGKVVEIAVKPGDVVEQDQVLVVLQGEE